MSAAAVSAFGRYNVAELAADPWGWRSEIEAWAKEHGEKRVLEWNTGSASRMAPATDRLYQAILDGRVSHDGHALLEPHLQRPAEVEPKGDLVPKDKRGSKRRIDAAIAAIVAHERAAHHFTRKAQRKRGPSSGDPNRSRCLFRRRLDAPAADIAVFDSYLAGSQPRPTSRRRPKEALGNRLRSWR